MSNKGNTKKEMQQRFAEMGIPKPVTPTTNPGVVSRNPEMASKMEQIRNGSLKNNFQQFYPLRFCWPSKVTAPARDAVRQ